MIVRGDRGHRNRSSTKLLRSEDEEKWTIGATQTWVALERVRRDLLRVQRFEDVSLLARRALERELRSHSGLIGVGTIEELITCKSGASIEKHSV